MSLFTTCWELHPLQLLKFMIKRLDVNSEVYIISKHPTLSREQMQAIALERVRCSLESESGSYPSRGHRLEGSLVPLTSLMQASCSTSFSPGNRGVARVQLGHDAAQAPHINGHVVGMAQDHLWGSVEPASDVGADCRGKRNLTWKSPLQSTQLHIPAQARVDDN